MSRICGIELRASDAILAVVEENCGKTELIDVEPKKIKLGNDESSTELKSFSQTFENFIRDNHIDTIVIKKRAKKGKMAGGAVSFKLEAMIQMNNIADVEFVSGQAIAAAARKNPIDKPPNLNKYQEVAFMSAILFIRKNKVK